MQNLMLEKLQAAGLRVNLHKPMLLITLEGNEYGGVDDVKVTNLIATESLRRIVRRAAAASGETMEHELEELVRLALGEFVDKNGAETFVTWA